MKYTLIEREASAFQQPVLPETIEKMCQRAFGKMTEVVSAQELGNGEYNTVYLLKFTDRDAVILRVAPRDEKQGTWIEHKNLMRREYILQPYFAAIASLQPKILMIDFTHQLLDRDYMFQTYMPGTLWSHVMDELTEDENDALWREFAHIAKTLSTTKGEIFGLPYPGMFFSTWSGKILNMLEQAQQEMIRSGLKSEPIEMLYDLATTHVELIDEVTTPYLLHGDLWPFNILIQREETGPIISAVLDADRGYWGDPFADWTFHLLERRASPRQREIFWQEFGRPEETLGFHFRTRLYKGIHGCHTLCWLHRFNLTEYQEEVYADLFQAIAEMQGLRKP